jgi:hypothetical protein
MRSSGSAEKIAAKTRLRLKESAAARKSVAKKKLQPGKGRLIILKATTTRATPAAIAVAAPTRRLSLKRAKANRHAMGRGKIKTERSKTAKVENEKSENERIVTGNVATMKSVTAQSGLTPPSIHDHARMLAPLVLSLPNHAASGLNRRLRADLKIARSGNSRKKIVARSGAKSVRKTDLRMLSVEC